MKINLKDAFLLDRYEKDISLKLQAGTDPDLASLASFPEDPSVHFFISAKYGMVYCDTAIDLEYSSFCSRCLQPVTGSLQIKNHRRMITDPLKEDADTILIDEHFMFFPEEEAKNQIIMEFPVRFLCSEDCKGLCPECGYNRNLENCGCETRHAGS